MMNRRLMMTSAIVAASLALPATVRADEPLKVVATFSILGDMVGVVGGDKIELTTLVGPDGDTHVYQPTPQAAKAVSEADVLIMNGLEFEGWLERLTEAASFDGALVVATDGVEAIAFDDHDDHDDHGDHDDHDHDKHDDHGDHDDHAEHDHEKHDDHDHEDHAEHHDHDHEKHDDHADHDDHDHEKEHAEHDHEKHDDHDHGEDHAEHDDHDHDHEKHDEEHAEHDDHDDHGDHHGHDHGAFDPHAWQSIDNAVIYVDNIAAGLAKADPDNAGTFFTNRAAYAAELEALDEEVTALMAALPEDKRSVVTSHDAFQYFARDYGLTFHAPQGLSTESEASAKDVAELIEQMREDNISAVFVENVTDSRLLEQIASETGARIGGTLYPGALSPADGPAASYIEMIRHNATVLSDALK